MPGEPITTKFKCDISDLKKGITEANKAIKLANSEFKAASAGMDDWSSTSDGLSAKLKQLTSVLESQKQKLENYKQQQKELNKSSEENGRRATELRQKLQELADQGVSKTSEEYKKYEKALAECEKEQKANKKAADSLKVTINNQEAAVSKTEKEIDKYGDELKDVEKNTGIFQKAVDKVNETFGKTEKAAQQAVNGGFTVLKGALAELVADGFRKAIDSAKEFAVSMITTAAEVKAQNAQYEQTFGNMAGKADEAIGRVAKSTGVLESRLKSSATGIYGFAKASGADTPKAMSLMETSLMTAADTAAYYDVSLEEATERLQAFMKGNFANDAALGVSCTEMTRNAAATELFGKKYNELSEIQKQETLLKMVTDAQKASGAMGQAARESDGWENVMGNLNEAWTQFKAKVGTPFLEALIPVIQEVTAKFQEWVNGINWDEFSKKVTDVCNGLVQGFKDFITNIDWETIQTTISDIGTKIKEGFQWFVDNKELIVGGFIAIGGAITAIKIMEFVNNVSKMVNVVKGWELATKAQTAAQWLLNAAQSASPITWVIIGITALVAAFVLLWNKSEGFRNFWINLWEGIKTACSVAWDWIKNVFTQLGAFFTETIPQWCSSLVTSFNEKMNQIKDFFSNLWNSIKETAQNAWNAIISFFTQTIPKFIDNIIKWFEELPYKIGVIIGKLLAYVVQFGVNLWNFATKDIPKFINKVVDWFKQLPSKIWTWLLNTINKVATWSKDIGNKAKEAATNFVNRVIDYVKELPNKIWTWLSNVISKVTTWASNLANKGREAATNFVNRVIDYVRELPSKIGSYLSNALSSVASWGSNLASRGIQAAQQLVNSVVNTIQSLPSKLVSIGKSVAEGIWSGISSMTSWLRNKVSSFVNGIVDGFLSTFKINSPSKLMANKVGRWIPEGIAVGIDKNAKSVMQSMKDLAMNTVGSAKDYLGNATSSLGGVSRMSSGGVVNNFTQVINSPKQLSRLDIYRQSKNLLGYVGGV